MRGFRNGRAVPRARSWDERRRRRLLALAVGSLCLSWSYGQGGWMYPPDPVAVVPRLLRTPLDMVLRVLFVPLAVWPFVLGYVLLKGLLGTVL